MENPVISEAMQKRLKRFASIKEEYIAMVENGGQITAVVKLLAERHQASTATIYKAIK